MREILIIEQGEDVVSVIDRLLKLSGEEAVIKLPSDSILFSNRVNFRLLKRESDSLEKKIIISTENRDGRRMAEEAGLEVEIDEEKEDSFASKISEVPRGRFPVPRGSLSDIVPGRSRHPNLTDIGRRAVPLSPDEEAAAPDASSSGDEEKKSSKRSLPAVEKKEDFLIEDDLFSWLEERKEPDVLQDDVRRDYSHPHLPEGRRASRAVWIFIASGVAVVTAVGFMALPRAEIKIIPKQDRIALELRVTADSGISTIDKKYNRVPAQVVSVEKIISRSFATSGSREVSEKARGIITVFNELDSTPQTLIPSRFEAADGKIYWSTETVLVPGASLRDGVVVPGEKTVEIAATEAGPLYNRDCSRESLCSFAIPAWRGTVKFDKIYARGSVPIAGGAVGAVKVAAGNDIIDALDKVLEEAKEEAQNELKKKLPPDLVMIDGSLQESVEENTASLKTGEIGDVFETKTRVNLKAYLFNPVQLVELARESVASRLAPNQKLGSLLEDVAYNQVRIDGVGGKISFTASGKAVVLWDINVENIKQEVLGKDEVELRRFLSSSPGMETAYIKLWPFWVKSVPRNANRVFISIDEK